MQFFILDLSLCIVIFVMCFFIIKNFSYLRLVLDSGEYFEDLKQIESEIEFLRKYSNISKKDEKSKFIEVDYFEIEKRPRFSLGSYREGGVEGKDHGLSREVKYKIRMQEAVDDYLAFSVNMVDEDELDLIELAKSFYKKINIELKSENVVREEADAYRRAIKARYYYNDNNPSP